MEKDKISKLREKLAEDLRDVINSDENVKIQFQQSNINKLDGFIGINHSHHSESNIPHEIKMSIYSNQILSKDCIEEKKMIESERNYKHFFHYKNILEKNNTLDHYNINTSSELIKWDKNGEKVILNNNDDLYITFDRGSDGNKSFQFSESLRENIAADESLKNLTDIVFFKPYTQNFLAIPIPFFSTPTIVLIISFPKAENISKDVKNSIIRAITNCTRQTVFNYFQIMLSEKIKTYFNKSISSISFESSTKWFVDQMKDILLPIKVTYQFNFTDDKGTTLLNDDEKFFFNEASNKHNEEFSIINNTINFSRNDCKINGSLEFKLKSFKYPDLIVLFGDPSRWFHKTKFYEDKLKVAIQLIQNNFELLLTLFSDKEKKQKELQKHILKATMANIISKGMAHTDASHTMLYFDSLINSNKKHITKRFLQDAFNHYNSHIKNIMEYTADITGGLGKQTYYSYRLDDFFQEINTMFVPNADKEKTSGEKFFLSKGLNDGEATSLLKVDIENNIKDQMVAVPGGENGKTAVLSILKGFFRNLYKHSKCIYHYYKATIIVSENNSGNQILNDYYLVELIEETNSYNSKEIKVLVKKINDFLCTPLYDEEKESISNLAWGLREMQLGAAYLIGLPFEDYVYKDKVDVFKELYPMKFFFCYEHKFEDVIDGVGETRFKLKYNFYVLKRKMLNFNVCEAKKQLKEANLSDKRYMYSLVGSDLSNYAKYFNMKVIVANQTENINEIDENELHKLWFEKFIKSKKISIDEKDMFLNNSSSIISFQPDKSFPLIDKDIKYIFDDHSFYAKKKELKTYQDFKRIGLKYYETITNNIKPPKVFIKYKSTSSNFISDNFQSFMKEVVLTKIAVLDERIQQYYNVDNDSNDKLTDLERFKLKNILIPKIGDKTDSGIEKEWDKFNIKELYEDSINGYSYLKELLVFYFLKEDCDYVLMHFSGVQKILKNKYSTKTLNGAYEILIKELCELDSENMLKNKILILVSGKGTPIDIPNNSFFLSFQNLEYALNKSKFHLVSILNDIRTVKSNL